jgi:putative hemolysin
MGQHRVLERVKAILKPHFPLRLEKGDFVVKTVSEPWELEQVLRLRYQVFMEEAGARTASENSAERWDFDEYDAICDHLIILKAGKAEKKDSKPGPDAGEAFASVCDAPVAGQVVGTYRLISSSFSDRFYSQTEFELGAFLSEPGVKLELGRACIASEHRRGAVMSLLWRGVAEYLRLTQARYLFGCSSVWLIDSPEVALLYRYLEGRGALVEAHSIRPRPEYECPGLVERLSAFDSGQTPSTEALEALRPLVPPLLEMYLLAGARVVGRPALDRDFGCVDFLTVLDTDRISQSFSRRYQGVSA